MHALFDNQSLLLTKASHGLLVPVWTLWQPRPKALRTIIPLWCPERQCQTSCFHLFIWMFDSRLPPHTHTHAPSSKWLGRESELVSTSKLRYPFMCFSGNGLTQWEASKYSSRDYRRQVTLAYAPQPTAWINVTFEQQPKCCCLIL